MDVKKIIESYLLIKENNNIDLLIGFSLKIIPLLIIFIFYLDILKEKKNLIMRTLLGKKKKLYHCILVWKMI